ncbi:hypothetical protein [Phenylobacterium sp.]|uniref:hypothetical protein n=1 Tax=Phenylobacterium sp. TaxID=1871053 RepID=UPI002F41564F
MRAAGGLLALLGAIGGLAGATPALAQGADAKPPTIEDRLSAYFNAPNTPETYRALTGQGDPHIASASPTTWSFVARDNLDAPLLQRLLPAGGSDYFVDLGDCRVDYALETLKARIATLGEDHPYVRRWIEVQRAVFQACGARRERASPAVTALPPPLAITDSSLARLQADDRAYQAAALSFYRGDRAGALAAFQRIAGGSSPHRLIARYMVAAIHAGSGPDRYGQSEPMVPPAQSIAELQAMLADPALKPIHPMVQTLLGWVGATVADAVTRKAQVAATLAALEAPAGQLADDPQARRRYALARDDIDHLHSFGSDRDPAWWLGAGPPEDFTASRAMMEQARTDPLAAWVLVPRPYDQDRPWAPFSEGGAAGWWPLETYIQKAAAAGGPAAVAWLHLRRAFDREYDAKLWDTVQAEETAAAAGEEPAIAALAFDFYHQVRLALGGWRTPRAQPDARFQAALAAMTAFPFKGGAPYRAARHDGLQFLMTAGRLADARAWRDALYPTDQTSWTLPPDDATLLQILAEDQAHFALALASPSDLSLQNNLSIATLDRLSADPAVPRTLRARFARVAWSRTYALGRTVDAALDRRMRELNPGLVANWSSRPGRPVRPDDRRVLLDVLRSPGLNILIVDNDRDTEPTGADDQNPGLTRIDLYNHDDDNWWCAWKTGHNARALQQDLKSVFFGWESLSLADGSQAYDLHDGLRPALAASFAFRSQDPAEQLALTAIPCAPKLLSERTLDWVRHTAFFRSRDGQAEALALAVKTTHYGCYSDGPHGAYSKAAWTELHTRFPDTDWARRTRYWFDCPLGGKDCPAVSDP